MSHTQGMVTQETNNPDLQIFVGASEFKDTSGNGTLASQGAGLLDYTLSSTQAGTFFADVTAMLKRTGVYAIPLWTGATANAGATQEAFGTAASVAGPTTVANTRGPLGTAQGVPPQLAATLDTLTGGVNGPQAKGMEITSIDVIYTVGAVNASYATVGLTDTNFVEGVAPNVVNRITLGSNSLPVAFATNPHVKNVAVGTPAFPVTTDTETIVNVNLTAGSGGTITFYGVVLHCNYNLN